MLIVQRLEKSIVENGGKYLVETTEKQIKEALISLLN